MESLRREPRLTATVVSLLALSLGGVSALGRLVHLRSLVPPGLDLSVRPEEVAGVEWGGSWTNAALPAGHPLTAHLQDLLTALTIAVLLAFAAACAAVWVLLRSHQRDRQEEHGIRVAVGASPRQLRLQHLAEGGILALAGLAGGALIGEVGRWVLDAALPAGLAVHEQAWSPGSAVPFMLSAALTILAALPRGATAVAGAAGRASSPLEFLRGGVGSSSDLLTGSLVALCVPLICGSTLAARGAAPDTADAGGERARDSVLLRVRLPPGAPAGSADTVERLRDLLDRVRRSGHVSDAGLSTPGAWAGLGRGYRIVAECDCMRGGMPVPVVGGEVRHAAAEPGFFRVLGWHGEEHGSDPGRSGGTREIRVNGAFDRELLAGVAAREKDVQVKDAPPGGGWDEIAGVFEHPLPGGLGTQRAAPLVMLPLWAHPATEVDLWVRGPAAPARLGRSARRAARDAIPAATVEIRGTRDRQIRRLRAPLEWFAWLLGVSGVLALVVSVIGVRAGTRGEMRRRRGELGLRRAVGARPRDVLGLALGWSTRVGGGGAAAGLVLGVPMAVALQPLMPGVVFTDWMAWVGVVALLFGAAVLGAWGPARKAARASPMESLRLW